MLSGSIPFFKESNQIVICVNTYTRNRFRRVKIYRRSVHEKNWFGKLKFKKYIFPMDSIVISWLSKYYPMAKYYIRRQ